MSDRERDPFERLAEEFAERCRRGESHSISEYERRYPEHAEKIRRLLPTVALMEQLKRGTARERGAEPRSEVMPERLGEFRVIRELGRGGMGVVYEAVQESLGRHVALKVIHHVHLDAKRLQRFQREAQAVARLHHTNIVPIFGVGEHDGLPYYVMQYIPGSGLDDLVTTWRLEGAPEDKARWAFVARVGVQAAEALEYAHEQGILHRDIKPANLLIDEHQAVWITDFGLAKLTGQDDLTASGDVIGTLRYLAPEALRGETDRRSDVYSLGLTLYELLTLTPPFGELSRSELLREVSEGRPTRPRKLDAAIPRDLETIVLKAIAREPAHRYPTAGALADDLNRFLEDRPIHARRATAFEQLWRWGRRNRLAAAMTATAAAAVLLATVVGWVGYVTTAGALRRAENNVALSLEVFGELFDRLAAHDNSISDARPPLGDTGGPRPPGYEQGPALDDEERWPPSPVLGPSRDPSPRRDHRGGPVPRRASSRGSGIQEDETELLQSVLTFYDRFARQNATNPRLEGEAGWAYRKVGALYERLGRDSDAEQAYARAIAMFEALVARYPNVPEYRSKLIQTYDLADPRSAGAESLDRLEKWLRQARADPRRPARRVEAPSNEDYARSRVSVYVCSSPRRCNAATNRTKPRTATAGRSPSKAGSSSGPRRSRPIGWIGRRRGKPWRLRGVLERGGRDEARALLDEAVADLRVVRADDRSPPPLHTRLRALAQAFQRLGENDRAAELARWADEDASQPHPPPPGGPGRRPSRPPPAPREKPSRPTGGTDRAPQSPVPSRPLGTSRRDWLRSARRRFEPAVPGSAPMVGPFGHGAQLGSFGPGANWVRFVTARIGFVSSRRELGSFRHGANWVRLVAARIGFVSRG